MGQLACGGAVSVRMDGLGFSNGDSQQLRVAEWHSVPEHIRSQPILDISLPRTNARPFQFEATDLGNLFSCKNMKSYTSVQKHEKSSSINLFFRSLRHR